ncbi:hypothetical protein IP92_00949 [Pseudoduganella flava]|uniref:DUF2239 family protein n=1 Tax=Pseudoduganella flava TaxID=871742 RepID=A0A562PZA9_9BURK|nr:DUF2239 family protein [Pseudoduganella flava]QGZ38697.1 DUF2239 family protein [Pseudoduganella flava]TWI49728.1 hypothetical protein IP92_00949 [Pseudoduganella flava]
MTTYTSFHGDRLIAAGDMSANAQAVRQALAQQGAGAVLTFDDGTGTQVDIDLRTSEAPQPAAQEQEHMPAAEPRGRGRPRLGVVAREVTLLPRHWEWLEAQPGGASVTLRKLVEEARRVHADRDARRAAQERAYRVMNALAGNLPGYEEATRALFADDAALFARHAQGWPRDVLTYVTRLAFGEQP